MEFLVSGTRIKELFCKDQIENIKIVIETSQILQNKQKEVLFTKLDRINEAPLMEKIRTMEQKFGIRLSREEKEILQKTRSKRNSLIHGKKDVEIAEYELNKLRSIIELLLISKVNNMMAQNDTEATLEQ